MTIPEFGRSRSSAGVGLRLPGGHARSPCGLRVVSETVAAGLYGLGFRRFAVDARETRPPILALGQARARPGRAGAGARDLSNAV
jgi:hypothetical protein